MHIIYELERRMSVKTKKKGEEKRNEAYLTEAYKSVSRHHGNLHLLYKLVVLQLIVVQNLLKRLNRMLQPEVVVLNHRNLAGSLTNPALRPCVHDAVLFWCLGERREGKLQNDRVHIQLMARVAA